MTWVRLDDGFADHPKLLAAGPLALVAQVRALCYCARHLTDGKLPEAAARAICADLAPLTPTQLCLAKLWHRNGRGYVVHDFLKYNPPRDEVIERREIRRETGRRGGLANALANAQAKPVAVALAKNLANACPGPAPTPTPTPKEEQKKKSSSTRHVVLTDDQFLATLKASPAYAGIDVDRELAKMDAWLLTPAGQRRQKTRRFIVQWLNRVEVPLSSSPPLSAKRINEAWKTRAVTPPGP